MTLFEGYVLFEAGKNELVDARDGVEDFACLAYPVPLVRGTFALLGAFRPKYRDSAFLFFVLALSGLALCRLGGMIAEGERTYLSFNTTIAPGQYNQVGLAMYELPNMIFAWVLFLLRPRCAYTQPI